MPERIAPETLKIELDRCVKCGMCLPECPTYRLAADENESPRGRLALIDGLIHGRLEADDRLRRHLDNCLLCRRCERVCPSQVRYGTIMDAARERMPSHRGNAWSALVQHPRLLASAVRLGRAMPAAVSRPWPALARLHGFARALPAGSAPTGEHRTTAETQRGTVGLFPGCATRAQQGGALNAALTLLLHAGYDVDVPADAACCGALAQHQGASAQAGSLATRNRHAFGDGLVATVSIASGCGIQLDSYDPPLAAPHSDICRFLIERGRLRAGDFRPLPEPVLLHTPCTVENVYRGGDWARALLSLIPGIELVPVGEGGQCCGAAGDHMLRHPETAVRLRQPVLEQAASAGAGILVTSNVGCAIHLADGLRRQGLAIETLHPVELLARQLVVGRASGQT